MAISAMNAAGAKLEKAYLTIMPASPSGVRPRGGTTLTFKFNPKEYSITKSANWSRTSAQNAEGAGPAQWAGTAPRTMTLKIFLDQSETTDGDILGDAALLFGCCSPTAESLRAKAPSGPYVLFGWGSTTAFTAFVKSVTMDYTMFRPNGKPYRGTATLTVEEVEVPTGAQNPTSGTLAANRTHTVLAGDSLPLIAHVEYRNPARWRVIAEANGIDDPLRLPIGMRLLLPAPDEAAGTR